jgi:hypothetical protein
MKNAFSIFFKIFTFTALISTLYCTYPGRKIKFYYENEINIQNHNTISFTFLGAAGFLLKWRNQAILLSPFFSNPAFFKTGFGKIRTDKDRVDCFFKKYITKQDRNNIKAIIIAHSHHDHLMDVPYIVQKYFPNSLIYCNKTGKHILSGFSHLKNSQKIIVLNDKQNQWIDIPETTIRIWPVKSKHAPHFLGLTLYGGKLNNDRSTQPKRACHWKMGETYAFIIDFLDSQGNIKFRIHYQDSPSDDKIGFPPDDLTNFNLSILCSASFSQVSNYPLGILNRLKPDNIILGHWENFFRSPDKPVRTVPLTNIRKFTKYVNSYIKMQEAKSQPKPSCILPKPGSTISYKTK